MFQAQTLPCWCSVRVDDILHLLLLKEDLYLQVLIYFTNCIQMASFSWSCFTVSFPSKQSQDTTNGLIWIFYQWFLSSLPGVLMQVKFKGWQIVENTHIIIIWNSVFIVCCENSFSQVFCLRCGLMQKCSPIHSSLN